MDVDFLFVRRKKNKHKKEGIQYFIHLLILSFAVLKFSSLCLFLILLLAESSSLVFFQKKFASVDKTFLFSENRTVKKKR